MTVPPIAEPRCDSGRGSDAQRQPAAPDASGSRSAPVLAGWLRAAAKRLERAGVDSPALEARLLVEHVLSLDTVQVFREGRRSLAGSELARLEALLGRRERGEPLQYVLGTAYFWSLRLDVGPGVLIPRPETEHLVEAVLAHLSRLPRQEDGVVIADLGIGSGAIALALLVERPDLVALGVDRSAAALRYAMRNAVAHGVAGRLWLYRGDWCRPLWREWRGRLAAVACNPPYIAAEEAPSLAPGVRAFEPHEALFAPGEPPALYREIALQALPLLAAGGLLALELPGSPFAAAIVDAVRALPGYKDVAVRDDYGGRARVLTARRRAADAAGAAEMRDAAARGAARA